MIIEDSGEQEKSRHYVGKVLKENNINFKRREIKFNDERVGDYLGEYTDSFGATKYIWIAERKRDQDFVSSTLDGRLEKQYEKLANAFKGKARYLIFEGDWNEIIKLNWAVRSLLICARLKAAWYGVSFCICKDEKETAAFLLSLDRYSQGFETLTIKERKPVVAIKSDKRIRPLLCVEKLGEKKSLELLDKFKTVSKIIELAKTNPEKLMTVKGIGKKIIENINVLYNTEEKLIDNNRIGKDKRCMGSYGTKTKGVHAGPRTPYINNANVYRSRKINKNNGCN